jgi:hypothetical protein
MAELEKSSEYTDVFARVSPFGETEEPVDEAVFDLLYDDPDLIPPLWIE